MTDVVDMGKFKQKAKAEEKLTWLVIDSSGQSFLATGTHLLTEEESTTTQVYDKNHCILVVLDTIRVEVHNDSRLQRIPAPPESEEPKPKPTKRTRKKA